MSTSVHCVSSISLTVSLLLCRRTTRVKFRLICQQLETRYGEFQVLHLFALLETSESGLYRYGSFFQLLNLLLARTRRQHSFIFGAYRGFQVLELYSSTNESRILSSFNYLVHKYIICDFILLVIEI